MTLWPQYTYLVLVLLGLGICIADHNKPRDPGNAWSSIIATGIVFFLLTKGGFFDGMLK
jgi:hypothetical protein